jgi:hypothetical protein
VGVGSERADDGEDGPSVIKSDWIFGSEGDTLGDLG